MPTDEYQAIWVSHSSIADFLACPRSYFLKNVYKDPQTNRKIQLITPALSLGSAIHQVVESLSSTPVSDRFKQPLTDKFNQIWSKYSGRPGGFTDVATEEKYKSRGLAMLDMIQRHPGPLSRLAVKIQMDLPHYWLSEKDNIILCGKLDWLEYLKTNDSVHIIDFKTSQKEEAQDSLQLPIYHLLALNCQSRKVFKASYWYLEKGPQLTAKKLPDPLVSSQKVLNIAKKIKLARQLNHFKCPQGSAGCRYCLPLESIITGQAEFVGVSDFRDNYLFKKSASLPVNSSIIL